MGSKEEDILFESCQLIERKESDVPQ